MSFLDEMLKSITNFVTEISNFPKSTKSKNLSKKSYYSFLCGDKNASL